MVWDDLIVATQHQWCSLKRQCARKMSCLVIGGPALVLLSRPFSSCAKALTCDSSQKRLCTH